MGSGSGGSGSGGSAIGNGISGSAGQSGGSNRTSAQEQSKYGPGTGTNLGSGTTGPEGILCKYFFVILIFNRERSIKS